MFVSDGMYFEYRVAVGELICEESDRSDPSSAKACDKVVGGIEDVLDARKVLPATSTCAAIRLSACRISRPAPALKLLNGRPSPADSTLR